MSSQTKDGIECIIEDSNTYCAGHPELPADIRSKLPDASSDADVPKRNVLNDLPPEVRSQLPESFGQTVNHSDAYIEFLKKHKDSKETTTNGGAFNGHPKDYLDFLAKQNK